MQKRKQNNSNYNSNNSKSISKKLWQHWNENKYSNKTESFKGSTWNPHLNKGTFFHFKKTGLSEQEH